jgi:hypothetical protein
MRKELLHSTLAHDVNADRSGKHTTRMKKQMQV